MSPRVDGHAQEAPGQLGASSEKHRRRPARPRPNALRVVSLVVIEVPRATGGVGLGLTIAKQLVEVHGGTIHVENVVPYGARFVFELPITAQDSPASRE